MSLFVRLWASATVKLLVLFSFAAMWIFAYEQNAIYGTQVRTTLAALRSTEQLLGALTEVENDLRDYTNSGSEQGYQRMLRSYDHLRKTHDRLQALNMPVALDNGRANVIELHLDQLLGHYDQLIRIAATSGPEAARNADKGTDHSQEIRMLLRAARAVQHERLAMQETAWEGSHAELRGVHSVAIPLTAIALLLLTWHTTRHLRKSVKSLIKAVEAVGQSNELTEITVTGSDEFSKLAVAFNRMIGRLRSADRAREEAERHLAQSNAELAAQTVALAERNRIMNLIGRMSHRLPGCETEQEFVEVVECFLPQLLSDTAGALYLGRPDNKTFYAAAQWNGMTAGAAEFDQTCCWAVRRGQEHHLHGPATDIACGHVNVSAVEGYICIPLNAQGETFGLLYFESPQGMDPAWNDRLNDLNVIAERLSLGLSNLRLKESLKSQSIRDPLTGLFNRRHLSEILPSELARASRQDNGVSVILLDIDHFKVLNDTYGHDVGDVVLRSVAAAVSDTVRSSDIVFRYGGEEILIVLPGTDQNTAFARAEKLRHTIRGLTFPEANAAVGMVTASFGIAGYPDCGRSWETLIRSADQALYRAKREGRDRVATVGELSVVAA